MKISEIRIRGVKSFGHNIQTFNLDTDCGKLCLLVGKNGAGKSSFINSFEYAPFGKCRGNNRKNASVSSFVNRTNLEMMVGIKFSAKGSEVEVVRGVNPNIFTFKVDGVSVSEDESKYNTMIEQYVGMDMLSFRSFISLSVNDFKNFIALKADEKQLLVDKLFNLESITKMASIVKDLDNINKSELIKNTQEVNSLELSIGTIEDTIKRIREPKVDIVDNTIAISDLVNKMIDYEPIFIDLTKKLVIIKQKEDALRVDFIECKKLYSAIVLEIKTVKDEIILFDSDRCPTCKTDFISDHFVELRETLSIRFDDLNKLKQTILDDNGVLKTTQIKIQSISEKINSSYKTVTDDIKKTKRRLSVLRKEEIKAPDVDLSEFEISIDKSKYVISDIEQKSNELLKKDKCYLELRNLFGPEGIKKTIISSIVKPLNKFIEESMVVIDLPFRVEINELFNVSVSHMGEKIDHDTLSTGESRLVNIAILIAYLKLIRTKKEINVLFLDEIFSSVDVDGVDILLKLLGGFAKEYNINIFVVHHSILAESYFDRIIKLEKNTFSNIITIK
jgi:DNA repair exonuclease SbcCD ATPase subunit